MSPRATGETAAAAPTSFSANLPTRCQDTEMIQLATRATPARELEQQKTDFTSEGSPPPRKVAKAVPATPALPVPPTRAISNGPVVVPAEHRHPSADR
jgi:hypothetical protein